MGKRVDVSRERGIGLRHDGRAVVCKLGVWRSAVEKTGCLSEMVAARVCREFQNAHPGSARPERLPARCFTRLRSLHNTASAEGAIKDVVFPRRRPLGAQAAEQPIVVQNGQRLGGSMV